MRCRTVRLHRCKDDYLMCQVGQTLRFIEVAGGDHLTIAKRTASTTIDWIGERFAGKTAPDDCGRL